MTNFAVLIPCFNAAAYLPELLEGIRAQTRPFDEVLVYDDASSDDTSIVAERLGARVIGGTENRGAAYARNRLIEASHSDWLHFHDADDLIAPNFLDRMIAATAPDIGAILCNIDRRDRSTRRRTALVDYSQLEFATDSVAYLLRHIAFAVHGLYARAWIGRVNFREDLRGSEDPDFHIRLAAAGCRFRVVPEPLVTVLNHKDSFSARNGVQCNTDKMKCLESYMHILPAEHRAYIGREALAIASAIYVSRSPEGRIWMERGIALAKMCGVRGAACQNPLKDAVAAIIGPRSVMRARRLRQRWGERVSR
jgi:glycosyltransferase involved in cell wall biosynthesis